MKKTLAITGITLAAIVGLSACSQPNVTVTPQASASATVSSEKPAADSWDNVTAFVKAQWDNRTKESLQYVSPGSPAEKYADYQIAVHEAERTNGAPSDDTAFTYLDDASEGTVTVTYPDGTEVVWSDFKVDPQGKIVSWTGKSGPLEDALWTKDQTVHASDTDVELVGAYRANGGSLYIVLDVAAGDHGAQLDYDPSYVVDGRSTKPSGQVGPFGSGVDPNTRAYYVYSYDGADFGGTFKTEVVGSDYDTLGHLSMKIA